MFKGIAIALTCVASFAAQAQVKQTGTSPNVHNVTINNHAAATTSAAPANPPVAPAVPAIPELTATEKLALKEIGQSEQQIEQTQQQIQQVHQQNQQQL